MDNLKIYWAGIEYYYSKASNQFGKLAGGFVYGFVKALNTKEALKKITDELILQHIVVKEVEFVSPYDVSMEWETKEQAKKYKYLKKQAESLDQVFFDDFYAYESVD